MKSNKIERNSNATAAGADEGVGIVVVRDHDSLSDGELESCVGGAKAKPKPLYYGAAPA